MSNIKVAVRVRPLNKREIDLQSKFIVEINGDTINIQNAKLDTHQTDVADSREKIRSFSVDYAYSSFDRSSPIYASQEMIYQDLGTEVLQAAYEGYNACLFAYGQTSTGKTYTMMGNQAEVGITPRLCEGLFARMDDIHEDSVTYCIDVSYLEIYNERVRDLLRPSLSRHGEKYTLKVREHPKEGPYVQDLSRHRVTNNSEVQLLLERGNEMRTTAATHMHDLSSRSHAILTINFSQAKLDAELPSETVSKVHLVDLAGSERANPHYNDENARGRLKEGANINKSLVTLGNVIKALADQSGTFQANDSMSSTLGSSSGLSPSSNMGSTQSFFSSRDTLCSSGPGTPRKPRSTFVPYRNSVLTWLLKDSLGGNSKTIMIATITPSSIYYNETLNTLRYATRAKTIINRPTVNEDSNVTIIRELRTEIQTLKMLLSQAQMVGSMSNLTEAGTYIAEKLEENEEKAKNLMEHWIGKWQEAHNIMRESDMRISRHMGRRSSSMGVIVDSELPHLIGMDDDILSTGIIMYHLKEGRTRVGTEDSTTEQDIVLNGPYILPEHCTIKNRSGIVTLYPNQGAPCAVNGTDVTQPTRLTQGDVILIGRLNMFRFNNPAEAAKLRRHRQSLNAGDLTEDNVHMLHKSLARTLSAGSLPLNGPTDPESPSPTAMSPLIMFNPGLELERQQKSEQERIEKARDEVHRLREQQRKAEIERSEREEEMYRQHERRRMEYEAQQRHLKSLLEESEKKRLIAEEEIAESRRKLEQEREKHQKILEAELERVLVLEKTIRSNVGTYGELAVQTEADEAVMCMETQTESHVCDLPIGGNDGKEIRRRKISIEGKRKELTQLELVQKYREQEEENKLEQQRYDFQQQMVSDIEMIASERKRLHQIEEDYHTEDASQLAEISAQTERLRSIEKKKRVLERYLGEGSGTPTSSQSDETSDDCLLDDERYSPDGRSVDIDVESGSFEIDSSEMDTDELPQTPDSASLNVDKTCQSGQSLTDSATSPCNDVKIKRNDESQPHSNTSSRRSSRAASPEYKQQLKKKLDENFKKKLKISAKADNVVSRLYGAPKEVKFKYKAPERKEAECPKVESRKRDKGGFSSEVKFPYKPPRRPSLEVSVHERSRTRTKSSPLVTSSHVSPSRVSPHSGKSLNPKETKSDAKAQTRLSSHSPVKNNSPSRSAATDKGRNNRRGSPDAGGKQQTASKPFDRKKSSHKTVSDSKNVDQNSGEGSANDKKPAPATTQGPVRANKKRPHFLGLPLVTRSTGSLDFIQAKLRKCSDTDSSSASRSAKLRPQTLPAKSRLAVPKSRSLVSIPETLSEHSEHDEVKFFLSTSQDLDTVNLASSTADQTRCQSAPPMSQFQRQVSDPETESFIESFEKRIDAEMIVNEESEKDNKCDQEVTESDSENDLVSKYELMLNDKDEENSLDQIDNNEPNEGLGLAESPNMCQSDVVESGYGTFTQSRRSSDVSETSLSSRPASGMSGDPLNSSSGSSASSRQRKQRAPLWAPTKSSQARTQATTPHLRPRLISKRNTPSNPMNIDSKHRTDKLTNVKSRITKEGNASKAPADKPLSLATRKRLARKDCVENDEGSPKNLKRTKSRTGSVESPRRSSIVLPKRRRHQSDDIPVEFFLPSSGGFSCGGGSGGGGEPNEPCLDDPFRRNTDRTHDIFAKSLRQSSPDCGHGRTMGRSKTPDAEPKHRRNSFPSTQGVRPRRLNLRNLVTSDTEEKTSDTECFVLWALPDGTKQTLTLSEGNELKSSDDVTNTSKGIIDRYNLSEDGNLSAFSVDSLNELTKTSSAVADSSAPVILKDTPSAINVPPREAREISEDSLDRVQLSLEQNSSVGANMAASDDLKNDQGTDERSLDSPMKYTSLENLAPSDLRHILESEQVLEELYQSAFRDIPEMESTGADGIGRHESRETTEERMRILKEVLQQLASRTPDAPVQLSAARRAIRQRAMRRQQQQLGVESDGHGQLSDDNLAAGKTKVTSRPGSGSRRRRRPIIRGQSHKGHRNSSEEYLTSRSETDSIFSDDSLTHSDERVLDRSSHSPCREMTDANPLGSVSATSEVNIDANGVSEPPTNLNSSGMETWSTLDSQSSTVTMQVEPSPSNVTKTSGSASLQSHRVITRSTKSAKLSMTKCECWHTPVKVEDAARFVDHSSSLDSEMIEFFKDVQNQSISIQAGDDEVCLGFTVTEIWDNDEYVKTETDSSVQESIDIVRSLPGDKFNNEQEQALASRAKSEVGNVDAPNVVDRSSPFLAKPDESDKLTKSGCDDSPPCFVKDPDSSASTMPVAGEDKEACSSVTSIDSDHSNTCCGQIAAQQASDGSSLKYQMLSVCSVESWSSPLKSDEIDEQCLESGVNPVNSKSQLKWCAKGLQFSDLGFSIPDVWSADPAPIRVITDSQQQVLSHVSPADSGTHSDLGQNDDMTVKNPCNMKESPPATVLSGCSQDSLIFVDEVLEHGIQAVTHLSEVTIENLTSSDAVQRSCPKHSEDRHLEISENGSQMSEITFQNVMASDAGKSDENNHMPKVQDHGIQAFSQLPEVTSEHHLSPDVVQSGWSQDLASSSGEDNHLPDISEHGSCDMSKVTVQSENTMGGDDAENLVRVSAIGNQVVTEVSPATHEYVKVEETDCVQNDRSNDSVQLAEEMGKNLCEVSESGKVMKWLSEATVKHLTCDEECISIPEGQLAEDPSWETVEHLDLHELLQTLSASEVSIDETTKSQKPRNISEANRLLSCLKLSPGLTPSQQSIPSCDSDYDNMPKYVKASSDSLYDNSSVSRQDPARQLGASEHVHPYQNCSDSDYDNSSPRQPNDETHGPAGNHMHIKLESGSSSRSDGNVVGPRSDVYAVNLDQDLDAVGTTSDLSWQSSVEHIYECIDDLPTHGGLPNAEENGVHITMQRQPVKENVYTDLCGEDCAVTSQTSSNSLPGLISNDQPGIYYDSFGYMVPSSSPKPLEHVDNNSNEYDDHIYEDPDKLFLTSEALAVLNNLSHHLDEEDGVTGVDETTVLTVQEMEEEVLTNFLSNLMNLHADDSAPQLATSVIDSLSPENMNNGLGLSDGDSQLTDNIDQSQIMNSNTRTLYDEDVCEVQLEHRFQKLLGVESSELEKIPLICVSEDAPDPTNNQMSPDSAVSITLDMVPQETEESGISQLAETILPEHLMIGKLQQHLNTGCLSTASSLDDVLQHNMHLLTEQDVSSDCIDKEALENEDHIKMGKSTEFRSAFEEKEHLSANQDLPIKNEPSVTSITDVAGYLPSDIEEDKNYPESSSVCPSNHVEDSILSNITNATEVKTAVDSPHLIADVGSRPGSSSLCPNIPLSSSLEPSILTTTSKQEVIVYSHRVNFGKDEDSSLDGSSSWSNLFVEGHNVLKVDSDDSVLLNNSEVPILSTKDSEFEFSLGDSQQDLYSAGVVSLGEVTVSEPAAQDMYTSAVLPVLNNTTIVHVSEPLPELDQTEEHRILSVASDDMVIPFAKTIVKSIISEAVKVFHNKADEQPFSQGPITGVGSAQEQVIMGTEDSSTVNLTADDENEVHKIAQAYVTSIISQAMISFNSFQNDAQEDDTGSMTEGGDLVSTCGVTESCQEDTDNAYSTINPSAPWDEMTVTKFPLGGSNNTSLSVLASDTDVTLLAESTEDLQTPHGSNSAVGSSRNSPNITDTNMEQISTQPSEPWTEVIVGSSGSDSLVAHIGGVVSAGDSKSCLPQTSEQPLVGMRGKSSLLDDSLDHTTCSLSTPERLKSLLKSQLQRAKVASTEDISHIGSGSSSLSLHQQLQCQNELQSSDVGRSHVTSDPSKDGDSNDLNKPSQDASLHDLDVVKMRTSVNRRRSSASTESNASESSADTDTLLLEKPDFGDTLIQEIRQITRDTNNLWAFTDQDPPVNEHLELPSTHILAVAKNPSTLQNLSGSLPQPSPGRLGRAQSLLRAQLDQVKSEEALFEKDLEFCSLNNCSSQSLNLSGNSDNLLDTQDLQMELEKRSAEQYGGLSAKRHSAPLLDSINFPQTADRRGNDIPEMLEQMEREHQVVKQQFDLAMEELKASNASLNGNTIEDKLESEQPLLALSAASKDNVVSPRLLELNQQSTQPLGTREDKVCSPPQSYSFESSEQKKKENIDVLIEDLQKIARSENVPVPVIKQNVCNATLSSKAVMSPEEASVRTDSTIEEEKEDRRASHQHVVEMLKKDLERHIARVNEKVQKSTSDSAIGSDFTDVESTTVSPRSSKYYEAKGMSPPPRGSSHGPPTNILGPERRKIMDRLNRGRSLDRNLLESVQLDADLKLKPMNDSGNVYDRPDSPVQHVDIKSHEIPEELENTRTSTKHVPKTDHECVLNRAENEDLDFTITVKQQHDSLKIATDCNKLPLSISSNFCEDNPEQNDEEEVSSLRLGSIERDERYQDLIPSFDDLPGLSTTPRYKKTDEQLGKDDVLVAKHHQSQPGDNSSDVLSTTVSNLNSTAELQVGSSDVAKINPQVHELRLDEQGLRKMSPRSVVVIGKDGPSHYAYSLRNDTLTKYASTSDVQFVEDFPNLCLFKSYSADCIQHGDEYQTVSQGVSSDSITFVFMNRSNDSLDDCQSQTASAEEKRDHVRHVSAPAQVTDLRPTSHFQDVDDDISCSTNAVNVRGLCASSGGEMDYIQSKAASSEKVASAPTESSSSAEDASERIRHSSGPVMVGDLNAPPVGEVDNLQALTAASEVGTSMDERQSSMPAVVSASVDEMNARNTYSFCDGESHQGTGDRPIIIPPLLNLIDSPQQLGYAADVSLEKQNVLTDSVTPVVRHGDVPYICDINTDVLQLTDSASDTGSGLDDLSDTCSICSADSKHVTLAGVQSESAVSNTSEVNRNLQYSTDVANDSSSGPNVTSEHITSEEGRLKSTVRYTDEVYEELQSHLGNIGGRLESIISNGDHQGTVTCDEPVTSDEIEPESTVPDISERKQELQHSTHIADDSGSEQTAAEVEFVTSQEGETGKTVSDISEVKEFQQLGDIAVEPIGGQKPITETGHHGHTADEEFVSSVDGELDTTVDPTADFSVSEITLVPSYSIISRSFPWSVTADIDTSQPAVAVSVAATRPGPLVEGSLTTSSEPLYETVEDKDGVSYDDQSVSELDMQRTNTATIVIDPESELSPSKIVDSIQIQNLRKHNMDQGCGASPMICNADQAEKVEYSTLSTEMDFSSVTFPLVDGVSLDGGYDDQVPENKENDVKYHSQTDEDEVEGQCINFNISTSNNDGDEVYYLSGDIQTKDYRAAYGEEVTRRHMQEHGLVTEHFYWECTADGEADTGGFCVYSEPVRTDTIGVEQTLVTETTETTESVSSPPEVNTTDPLFREEPHKETVNRTNETLVDDQSKHDLSLCASQHDLVVSDPVPEGRNGLKDNVMPLITSHDATAYFEVVNRDDVELSEPAHLEMVVEDSLFCAEPLKDTEHENEAPVDDDSDILSPRARSMQHQIGHIVEVGRGVLKETEPSSTITYRLRQPQVADARTSVSPERLLDDADSVDSELLDMAVTTTTTMWNKALSVVKQFDACTQTCADVATQTDSEKSMQADSAHVPEVNRTYQLEAPSSLTSANEICTQTGDVIEHEEIPGLHLDQTTVPLCSISQEINNLNIGLQTGSSLWSLVEEPQENDSVTFGCQTSESLWNLADVEDKPVSPTTTFGCQTGESLWNLSVEQPVQTLMSSAMQTGESLWCLAPSPEEQTTTGMQTGTSLMSVDDASSFSPEVKHTPSPVHIDHSLYDITPPDLSGLRDEHDRMMALLQRSRGRSSWRQWLNNVRSLPELSSEHYDHHVNDNAPASQMPPYEFVVTSSPLLVSGAPPSETVSAGTNRNIMSSVVADSSASIHSSHVDSTAGREERSPDLYGVKSNGLESSPLTDTSSCSPVHLADISLELSQIDASPHPHELSSCQPDEDIPHFDLYSDQLSAVSSTGQGDTRRATSFHEDAVDLISNSSHLSMCTQTTQAGSSDAADGSTQTDLELSLSPKVGQADGCNNGDSEITAELERLQKERLHVVELLGLEYLPSKVWIELTEAHLNYAFGQTDTLLQTLDQPWESEVSAHVNRSQRLHSIDEQSEDLTRITKEYLEKYRTQLEMSKQDLDFRIQVLEKEKMKFHARESRSRVKKEMAKLKHKAEIEIFKMERERENTSFERVSPQRPGSSISSSRPPTASPAKSPKDSLTPPSSHSVSVSPGGNMTPRQHNEYLINLRRDLVAFDESSAGLSPPSSNPSGAFKKYKSPSYELYSQSPPPSGSGNKNDSGSSGSVSTPQRAPRDVPSLNFTNLRVHHDATENTRRSSDAGSTTESLDDEPRQILMEARQTSEWSHREIERAKEYLGQRSPLDTLRSIKARAAQRRSQLHERLTTYHSILKDSDSSSLRDSRDLEQDIDNEIERLRQESVKTEPAVTDVNDYGTGKWLPVSPEQDRSSSDSALPSAIHGPLKTSTPSASSVNVSVGSHDTNYTSRSATDNLNSYTSSYAQPRSSVCGYQSESPSRYSSHSSSPSRHGASSAVQDYRSISSIRSTSSYSSVRSSSHLRTSSPVRATPSLRTSSPVRSLSPVRSSSPTRLSSSYSSLSSQYSRSGSPSRLYSSVGKSSSVTPSSYGVPTYSRPTSYSAGKSGSSYMSYAQEVLAQSRRTINEASRSTYNSRTVPSSNSYQSSGNRYKRNF